MVLEHMFYLHFLPAVENVTSGAVEAELKYGILPLFNKTWSLCDFAKEQGWQCPLIPGAFRVHFNTTVPSFAPHVSRSYCFLHAAELNNRDIRTRHVSSSYRNNENRFLLEFHILGVLLWSNP